MKNKKILIIGAHPDDETLGCGGLIIKSIKNNCKISILTLGEGVSSRFEIGMENSEPSLIARKIRESEFTKCLKFLKIKDHELHHNHCTKFDKYPLTKFVKIIEEKIKKFKPSIILTHNPYDTNIDHKITYEAVNVACRPSKLSTIRKILTFEVPCSTHLSLKNNFRPNFYLDISHEIQQKIKAANFFKNEMRPYPFPRSIEGIQTLSKLRGMQSGCNYAEAYFVEREIVS